MANPNPFKELEPDATCPPHLKTEIVSEITLIRNVMTVIDLYVGDLFNVAFMLTDTAQTSLTKSKLNHETTS